MDLILHFSFWRRSALSVIALLLACTIWPANAYIRGSLANNNRLVLNIGQSFNSGTGIDYPWINYMKQWRPASLDLSLSDPGVLDGNGYPSSTLAADWQGQVNTIPTSQQGSTIWVLRWSGQCGTSSNCLRGLFSSTVVSDPGNCVQGSTDVSTILKGNDCRVEFTWGSSVADPTFRYVAGGELNGTLNNLALYRKSDETAYLESMASSLPFGGFNPDYIAALRALGVRALRFLNFNCINPTANMQSTVAMQTPVAAQSFGSNYFPSLWAGSTTSGSGVNAAYRATAPGGITTLTDGMAMQLKFVSAGSGTMTLSIDGGATNVAIADLRGIDRTSIAANEVHTVVYDAILNKWISRVGGASTCVPVPVMVALANAVNADMWYTIPFLASDALVTDVASQIKAALNSSGTAIYEYSNETWNFTYAGTKLGEQRGIVLFGAGNSPELSWSSLRSRQLFQVIKTAYGSQPNYKFVLAGQAVNSSLFNLRVAQGSQLNPISNSVLCLYLGGTFSGSCSGAPDYSTSPNRPIDFADWISYATYWYGAQTRDLDTNYVSVSGQTTFNVSGATSANPIEITTSSSHGYTSGQRVYLGLNAASGTGIDFTGTGWSSLNSSTGGGKAVTVTAANKFTIPVDGSSFPAYSGNGGSSRRFADEWNGLLAAADAFAVSGAVSNACNSDTTAIAWIDCDIRSGTNYGVLGFATLDDFNLNTYPAWESIATSYDASRPALGKANVAIVAYEGALQAVPPAASTCTTVGISSSYCGDTGKIANLLGWKSSPAAGSYKTTSLFQATTKRQMDQFMAGGGTIGSSSHSLYPSWLLLTDGGPNFCGGIWALYICDIYVGGTFKSYDAVKNYRYPFLLKRDLDPASNDNSPMWLEKAA